MYASMCIYTLYICKYVCTCIRGIHYVSMYIPVCTCMHVYTYLCIVYVHTYMYAFMSIYMFIPVRKYVRTYLYIYAYTCFIYPYIYVNMYVCACVHMNIVQAYYTRSRSHALVCRVHLCMFVGYVCACYISRAYLGPCVCVCAHIHSTHMCRLCRTFVPKYLRENVFAAIYFCSLHCAILRGIFAP